MRELLIGGIVVGLAIGILVGRNTEKSRRSFQDRTSARATYDKSRKAVWTETPKAVLTVLIVAVFLVALFIGTINLQR